MRAKTLVELLTLSSNLYLISKDEKMMNNLKEMAQKGKEKFNDLVGDLSDEEGDLFERMVKKAEEAKAELEQKIAETVEKMYDKMKIAHVNQISELKDQIESLKKELALSEARIVALELNRSK